MPKHTRVNVEIYDDIWAIFISGEKFSQKISNFLTVVVRSVHINGGMNTKSGDRSEIAMTKNTVFCVLILVSNKAERLLPQINLPKNDQFLKNFSLEK